MIKVQFDKKVKDLLLLYCYNQKLTFLEMAVTFKWIIYVIVQKILSLVILKLFREHSN